MMNLTELQRLRFILQIQERELAALFREPTDLNRIAITEQAIQHYKDKMAFFPPD
jgi:hypothetical protein